MCDMTFVSRLLRTSGVEEWCRGAVLRGRVDRRVATGLSARLGATHAGVYYAHVCVVRVRAS